MATKTINDVEREINGLFNWMEDQFVFAKAFTKDHQAVRIAQVERIDGVVDNDGYKAIIRSIANN